LFDRTEAGVRSRTETNVRRFVRDLLPDALRRRYHRYALARDFGIDAATGLRGPTQIDPTLPRGINLVGCFESPTGIGQSVRALARAAEGAGLPVTRLDSCEISTPAMRRAPHAVNLFHVNADGAASIVELAGPGMHRGRANVGYWYWETEEFPAAWGDRFAYFDEIWVASEFCRAAIGRAARIPVVVVPPPVIVEAADGEVPARTADAPFRMLTLCDAESVPERKNPLGAVRAFVRAFGADRSVLLMVKIANAASAPGLVESLREAAGLARVRIDESAIDRTGIDALLVDCDAYVSLHRSEGFGLPIAEAMALGKPVVATGYSGPCDFLDETTGYPVRWRFATTDRALGPYPAGTRWAEPDEEHAAVQLRRLVGDRAGSTRRGEAARRRIEQVYGLASAGRVVAERVARLLARLSAVR
jgi:glycosyltransferase involved in cell wall biosynthesis